MNRGQRYNLINYIMKLFKLLQRLIIMIPFMANFMMRKKSRNINKRGKIVNNSTAKRVIRIYHLHTCIENH